jgi:hypothetical protein
MKLQDHDEFSELDHRAPPSRQGEKHRRGIAPTRLSDLPRAPDATSKLGKIQSPQMGRIHQPLRVVDKVVRPGEAAEQNKRSVVRQRRIIEHATSAASTADSGHRGIACHGRARRAARGAGAAVATGTPLALPAPPLPPVLHRKRRHHRRCRAASRCRRDRRQTQCRRPRHRAARRPPPSASARGRAHAVATTVMQTATAICAVPESSAARKRTTALRPGARGITTARNGARYTRRVSAPAKRARQTAASECFMLAPRRACTTSPP